MQRTHGRQLSDSTVIHASSEQTSADMEGETVILHPKSGRYYGLEGVGTRVWELVQTPRTLGDIQRIIVDEYDVEPETCAGDIAKLVIDLCDAGLISIDHGSDR